MKIIATNKSILKLKNVSVINYKQAQTTTNDTLIYCLADDDLKDVYKVYRNMVTTLRANKVIYVDISNNVTVNRLLSMLLISNNQYNIYKAEASCVDIDYLKNISELDASLTDVIAFIDEGAEYYESTFDLLCALDTALQNDDVIKALTILKENANMAKYTVEFINYLKSMTTYYSAKVDEMALNSDEVQTLKVQLTNLEKECEALKTEYETMSHKNSVMTETATKVQAENDKLKLEYEEAKNQITEIKAKLEEENGQLKIDYENALVQQDHLIKIQEEATQLKQELKESQDELKITLETKETLETEKNELQQRIKELEGNVNESITTEEVEHLQDELDTLKKTYNTDLNSKNRELEELEKKLELLTTQLTEYEEQIKTLEDNSEIGELNDTKNQLDEKITELETTKEELKTISEENDTLKGQNEELMQRLNAKGPTIVTYATLPLTSQNCKTSKILYFKEISYVPYMNTFVCQLLNLFKHSGKDKKLKTKLIIYDNKTDFPLQYSNLPVITGENWMEKREEIITSVEKFVVIDQLQSILEDILKSELNLVIIYDRLKNKNDLVSDMNGEKIQKYWVINSATSIEMLPQVLAGSTIRLENIITRPYVKEGTIGLSTIKNYRQRSNAAKLADWVNLVNFNTTLEDGSNDLIIPSILEKLGIKLRISQQK